ncbi:MAG: hypothetical protein ABR569_07400 [Gaiellaceae bacterium]
MQRLLSTVVVLGLLIATAAAFAITEGLKLTPSPITQTQVSKVLSPICGCKTGAAAITFWLRRRDRLTLDVLTSDRREVKRLVDGVSAHRKFNTFRWNGRTSSGSVAPNGTYLIRVHLSGAHRTILLPNRIELDTRAPKVLDAKPNRTVFSPDGDRRSDNVRISYRLDESGHALLFVRGHLVVRTRFARNRDSLTWYGRMDGSSLPAGTYRLRLGALDSAGNVTGADQRAVITVRIRYITLARSLIPRVTAGARVGVGVETDAASYDWRLGAAEGRSNADVLVARAPKKPGRYRLVVTENGHSDSARVFVVRR